MGSQRNNHGLNETLSLPPSLEEDCFAESGKETKLVPNVKEDCPVPSTFSGDLPRFKYDIADGVEHVESEAATSRSDGRVSSSQSMDLGTEDAISIVETEEICIGADEFVRRVKLPGSSSWPYPGKGEVARG
ncbi:hypothetical protein QFC20_000741 [Naganishia adeliensis]|uniref:Uncharacterized protein n=1 Tax=Naganishia adeliensis TaxID=92952 RepID=A0ACC2WX30_9TREE|nr:hypothetical protein QFC20_000741 [Naganishia adeliensis]